MTAAARTEVLRALTSAQRVVVVAHVNPDPDALGSSIALASALAEHRGIPAFVTFDADPFVVPRSLAWLPGMADYVVDPGTAWSVAPDAVVAVDCAAPDRLGSLLVRAQAAPTFAVIDHHRSNPGFGDICLVDVAAPAAGEIVAGLLDELGWTWSPTTAAALYAAIASDTGSFRFPATTATTHRLAARLHEAGVDHAEVSRRLFSSRPLPVVQLAGQMVADARHFPEAAAGNGVIAAVLSKEERHAAGVGYDDVESLVGDLAGIDGIDVAVLVKEDDAGVWRVSARSKGAVDLGALAVRRGGGGHIGAAGYSGTGQPEDILADFIDGLAEVSLADGAR